MDSSQGEGQKIRRRIFLIDRKFQFKWTFIIVAVGVLVSAGLGYFIIRLNLTNTELLELDAAYADQVAKYDAMAIYYLVGFVLVMAIFLFIWGIIMTHRVAGPIYIISRYLRQMASGEPPKPRPLRKGDELKDFFESFSSMLASLKERASQESKLLDTAIGELKKNGADQNLIESLEKIYEEKNRWAQG